MHQTSEHCVAHPLSDLAVISRMITSFIMRETSC